ncbi:MAG TPA: pyridoxal-phosphate dependent enzyme, partial [Chroococcales cyanobacterium]
MEKISIRPTTFFEFPAENCSITIASEIHQHTGSFKFRAAHNLVSKTPNDLFIAASSGNFGQALAYACRLFGRKAIVVMPDTSAKVKIEAVRAYGGQVELVDVRKKTRAQRVKELALLHPEAYLASAYDDPLVIEGNATLGKEISSISDVHEHPFDVVVVPVGGGGLSAGIVQGIRQSGKKILVFGAEPLLANDAARSLRAGR